jgi:murein DD-endopeptidase MepM/ murein hydrolase activator NlpD
LSFGRRHFATLAMIPVVIIAAAGVLATADAENVVLATDQLVETQQTVLALHDTVRSLRAFDVATSARGAPPSGMMMPVSGPITSRFARSRLHPLLQIFRPHHGVDVAAPKGTPIVAPAAARVRFVGWRTGDGLTVDLEHGGQVITRFAHCSTVRVKEGERVNMGDTIAAVGSTGLTTGPHLHFEVLLRGRPVDPMRFISALPDAAASTADRSAGGVTATVSGSAGGGER